MERTRLAETDGERMNVKEPRGLIMLLLDRENATIARILDILVGNEETITSPDCRKVAEKRKTFR